MADLLVFFGSSEGFNYEIFDNQGKFNNFERLFPDFEHFESKVFSTDRVDNKPILAKYKLKIAGKSITLLKYYTFAQSSFSSRFEGSNIGVALLSEDDLQINKINYTLLKKLLDEFQQKTLNNNKFIRGDFSNEAYSIYQEFKINNSFSFIEKQELKSNIISQTNPCGVFISEFNDDLLKNIPENFDRVYLTADKEHLKRVFDNSSSRFNIWFFENNKLISLKEQNEIKELEKQKIRQSNVNSHSKYNNANDASSHSNQNELLQHEFNQLKTRYKYILKKKKLLSIVVSITSLLLIISLLFNIFKKSDTKATNDVPINSKNSNIKNIQSKKLLFNDIAISFIDSIVKDKDKLKNFTGFLLYINNVKNDKITSVTNDQFDEIKLHIESYGILEFDDDFLKKNKILISQEKNSLSNDIKKNIAPKDKKQKTNTNKSRN